MLKNVSTFLLQGLQISAMFAASGHDANIRRHWPLRYLHCTWKTTVVLCESKLNLAVKGSPAPDLHRVFSGERSAWCWWAEISVGISAGRAVHPPVPCSKWLRRNWTVAGEQQLFKLLSNPSTCGVPVLELKKRADLFFSFSFFSSNFFAGEVKTETLSAELVAVCWFRLWMQTPSSWFH